jgi:hypothetical protein
MLKGVNNNLLIIKNYFFISFSFLHIKMKIHISITAIHKTHTTYRPITIIDRECTLARHSFFSGTFHNCILLFHK